MTRFFLRTTPRVGQKILAVLLLLGFYNLVFEAVPNSAGYLVGDSLSHWSSSPAQAVSLVAWFPQSLIHSRPLFWFLVSSYAVFGLLWFLRKWVPWSAWGACLSHTLAISLYLQTQTYVSHSFQLVNQILLIHALWYSLEATRIKAAMQQACFEDAPLYPRWVMELSVLAIAIFYGLAGLNKIRYHGLDWFDGLNMQLFVHLFADHQSQFTGWLLNDRALARWGQILTVLVEIGAFLALIPRLRGFVAIGLLGLHLGIYVVFGWPFLANVGTLTVVLFGWHLLQWPAKPAGEEKQSIDEARGSGEIETQMEEKERYDQGQP